jgi:hypothetical protein
VPGDVGQIGEGLGFRLGFLDTALPKIPQPQGVGVTDDRNWHLFGDCHQADVGGEFGFGGRVGVGRGCPSLMSHFFFPPVVVFDIPRFCRAAAVLAGAFLPMSGLDCG